MQAMRSRRLAHCIALFAVAFASCSDREDAVEAPSATAGTSASCISCAGAAAGDDGGGSSAGGQVAAGGKNMVVPSAGKAGSASAGAHADGGVGTTHGGEGGSGGEGPISEKLTLCDRLTQVQAKEEDVTDQFERSAWLDCRVHWLPDLYVHPAQGPQVRDDYINALERWNLRFWGCDDVPVETFELVWGEPPLSRGDVDILIGYYMDSAIEHLDLSPKEQDEMLAALKRLSTLVVTNDALEASKPSCSDGGAGGEGPAAGAHAGGAGNAGESALGGMPNLGGAP